jgi:transporter family-2 protein
MSPAKTLLLVAALPGGGFRVLTGLAEQPLWKLSGGLMGALFIFGTTFLAPRIGLAALLSFVIAGRFCVRLPSTTLG